MRLVLSCQWLSKKKLTRLYNSWQYKNTNLLRVTFSENQRNRGHSSKFNLAHTLSIGRPRSHTYYKDVRLLKFSLVWEKST